MIWPGRASNPDLPITVAKQHILRSYEHHHRGMYLCTNMQKKLWNRFSKFLVNFLNFTFRLSLCSISTGAI